MVLEVQAVLEEPVELAVKDKVMVSLLHQVLAEHQVLVVQEETQELLPVTVLDKVELEELVDKVELEELAEPVAHGVIPGLQVLAELQETQEVQVVQVLTETMAVVLAVVQALAVLVVLVVLQEALADITYKIVIT